MQHVSIGSLWRVNFVNAVRSLGTAVARLPFGVPDPVICGATAVELYSGGLWSSSNLEVLAVEARPLVTELFAVGFRWTERPLRRDTGLWHPKFAIGVDIIEGLADLDWAAQSNVLRVALNESLHDTTGGTREWLNVVGIEDLIVRQITSWMAGRAPGDDTPACIDVLDALGRAGVGGRLRVGYLQRRLAWETHGAIELGSWSSEEGAASDPVQRTTTLSRMGAVIAAWRARCGLSFDTMEGCKLATGGGRLVRRRNGPPGRAGRSSAEPSNVVPFTNALRSERSRLD
jgi:hypothetical protein